jgi:hypothetical protein
VGTSTWLTLIGASTTAQADMNVLATSTCSITNLIGCVQNALVWAFVPNQASMQSLQNVGSQLISAPPIGYISSYRASILATSTASSTLTTVWATSTLSVLNTVLAPLSTGFQAIWWAMFAIGEYKLLMAIIPHIL